MLLEVKVVLAPDERRKGVLKATEGVTGNSTIKVLIVVVEPMHCD